MANLLFTSHLLSNLQKQVCLHIIDSVHSEATRMREEWETAISQSPAPPPPPQRTLSRQASSHDASSDPTFKGKATDTYCYELLSMLGGLSQSEPGCKFLVEQTRLLQDLLSLLHTSTTRLQLQVLQVCPYSSVLHTFSSVGLLSPSPHPSLHQASRLCCQDRCNHSTSLRIQRHC